MPNATAIIATPYVEDFRACQSVLNKMADVRLVAHVPGLMELFSRIESSPPNLVLVSSILCEDPNFELLISLFTTLDIRWTRFESNDPRYQNSKGKKTTQNRGIFPVLLDGNEFRSITQIRSVLMAHQSPQNLIREREDLAPRKYKKMVLIGASTGGVDALKKVLQKFQTDCPPTIVVQHTGQGFGTGLTAVLSRSCNANVQIFQPNQRLTPGTIHVIAGEKDHVVLKGKPYVHLSQTKGDLVDGHRPSINRLFQSAVPYAKRVTAAVLTGMGRDGADGLLELRKAGATTLAQDEKSSVVYGMPAAAWKNGGAMKQISLDRIGDTLLNDAIL